MKTSGLLFVVILILNEHVNFVKTAPVENESDINVESNLTKEISDGAILDHAEKSGITETTLEDDNKESVSENLSKFEDLTENFKTSDDVTKDDEISVKTDDINEGPFVERKDETNRRSIKSAENLEISSEPIERNGVNDDSNTNFKNNNQQHIEDSLQSNDKVDIISNAHIDKISNIETSDEKANQGEDRKSDEISNSEIKKSETDTRRMYSDTNGNISKNSQISKNSGESTKPQEDKKDGESKKPEIILEVVEIETPKLNGEPNNDDFREKIDGSESAESKEGGLEEEEIPTSEKYNVPEKIHENDYFPLSSGNSYETDTETEKKGGYDIKNLGIEDRRMKSFTDNDANIQIKSRSHVEYDDNELVKSVKAVSNNDIRTFYPLHNLLDSRRNANQVILPHLRSEIETNGLIKSPILHDLIVQRSSENQLINYQQSARLNIPQSNPVISRSHEEISDRHISEFNNIEKQTANAYPFEPFKAIRNINQHAGASEMPLTRMNAPNNFETIPNVQVPSRNVQMPLFNMLPVQNYQVPVPKPLQAAYSVPLPPQNIQMPIFNMQYPAQIQNYGYGVRNMHTPAAYRYNSLPTNHPLSSQSGFYRRSYGSQSLARSGENYNSQAEGYYTKSLGPQIRFTELPKIDVRYSST